MNDLTDDLARPDTRLELADDRITITTGGDERHVSTAQVVEPLVEALSEDRIAAHSVHDLADLAVAALRAVADRRITRSGPNGRWREDGPDPDPRTDAFVHAFVTGGALPDDTATGSVELTVDVDDQGRAHIAPATSSDRHTQHTLRSAAHLWPPVGRLAAGADATELTEAEVGDVLDPTLRGALGESGIRVAWARGVEVPGVAVALDDDAGLDWQLRIADGALTGAEIDDLTASQRPLVRMRGTWMVSDTRAIEGIRRQRPRTLGAGERARALVTGVLGSANGTVPLVDPTATRRRLAELTAQPPAVPAPAALQATLRQYQLQALAWMLHNARFGLGSCLADDMGLGKTVSAIAFHLALRERGSSAPTLVVCPASVLSTWEREIARFAPTEHVTRYHGPGRGPDPQADILVTTYATLRADQEILAQATWGLVVADEAQMAKNSSSQTARALRTLTTSQRLALSGTPIQNSLDDLWSLLDWTAPGLLGTHRQFRARFSGPIREGNETARLHLAELTSLAVLRRRKGDPGIAPELPDKTITDQVVALTNEQIGLYQAVVEASLAQIAELDQQARRGRVLALLTALKQVCNHPAHYLGQEDTGPPGRSGKLDALTEIIDIADAEDSPALIFTQYVTMGRLIARHLQRRGARIELLHGGLDLAARGRLIDAFQAGELPHLVLSTHAAGTGLTLTRAEHVIHYDQWWNPAVEDQATDRAHRIGQTHPVHVHRLLSEGTLEERIDRILHDKRELSASILDDEAGLRLSELDDSALTSLITLTGGRS